MKYKKQAGMIKTEQVLQIQKLRSKLNLSKKSYQELLINNFGVNTCLYLSFNQAQNLIDYLSHKVNLEFKLCLKNFPYLEKLLKTI